MDGVVTTQLCKPKRQPWLQSFFVRMWLRRQPVFVRSSRLCVEQGGTQTLRLTFASIAADYATAEKNSEHQVNELIEQGKIAGQVQDLQWKRGRFVTVQTFAGESELVQSILTHLMKSHLKSVVNIERIDDHD